VVRAFRFGGALFHGPSQASYWPRWRADFSHVTRSRTWLGISRMPRFDWICLDCFCSIKSQFPLRQLQIFIRLEVIIGHGTFQSVVVTYFRRRKAGRHPDLGNSSRARQHPHRILSFRDKLGKLNPTAKLYLDDPWPTRAPSQFEHSRHSDTQCVAVMHRDLGDESMRKHSTRPSRPWWREATSALATSRHNPSTSI
jgi:hypothetical protein